MENEQLVMDVLTNSATPLKSGQIAEMTNLDKKDVDNLIKKLKKEEKICSPKMCFYEVKK